MGNQALEYSETEKYSTDTKNEELQLKAKKYS